MANRINVEVVAGTPERQLLIAVDLAEGASAADAIEASGIADALPNFDVRRCAVAIWGRLAGRGDPLKDGDRVELLRPLHIDPREARRQLAETGQVMGSMQTPTDKAVPGD